MNQSAPASLSSPASRRRLVVVAACALAAASACDEARDGAGDADGGDPAAPAAAGASDGSGGAVPPPAASCEPGKRRCVGAALEACGDDGAFAVVEQCGGACDGELGCVDCAPGRRWCSGDDAYRCGADGRTVEVEQCDPLLGLGCDDGSGRCEGPCAPGALGTSYIGCEYFPTVTANLVDPSFDFAVVVSNTGGDEAVLTLEGGALLEPRTIAVAAGSVVVETLPWTDTKGWAYALYAPRAAYRLRSTRPVTVYQFSPLHFSNGADTYSMTNDASLLLPANVLGSTYRVASWPAAGTVFPSSPGTLTVTAAHDDTHVTVTPSAAIAAGLGVPAFDEGVATAFALERGDVLQLYAHAGDLTGSLVSSDKPVQVIGGHYCTYLPEADCCCDHLEETMLPVPALGRRYLVTAPAAADGAFGSAPSWIRVVATQAETTLDLDPPADAPIELASPGDVFELGPALGDVEIVASAPVLVAQYLLGQHAQLEGVTSGDPAMTLAVPTEQFRRRYRFHAPLSYVTNFVNLVAPLAAEVELDGEPVTGFAAVSDSGFGVARVELGAGPAGDGDHVVESSEPLGATAYGYAPYTSYFYPAGLDVKSLD